MPHPIQSHIVTHMATPHQSFPGPPPHPCQTPKVKMDSRYAQDSRPPSSNTCSLTGTRKSWAYGQKQMTYPLFFSEWRLEIEKQSKGGKRQTSSHGTWDHSPHSFPHPIQSPMLTPPLPTSPTTRTSLIHPVYTSLLDCEHKSIQMLCWLAHSKNTHLCVSTHMLMHAPPGHSHTHMHAHRYEHRATCTSKP